MQTTILKPMGDHRTSKTYALQNGKPVLTNTYDNMYEYKWAVAKFKDLTGFYNLLDRCKDKRVIRISGAPKKQLPNVVRRLKANFVTNETQLIYFDADSWKLPKGYNLRTKEDIHRAVKHVLCDKIGLECLRECACVVLLSNSSWSYTKLRAHIYFIVDSPIDIEDMHSWGKAYNSLDNEYKIDYSVFRRVQPDFIAKRVCDGFNDPIPDRLRLTLHCDNLSPCVSAVALKGHTDSDVKMAEAFEGISTTSVVKSVALSGKGESWEQTLQLCGSAQHGINDPSYRACAQLVQSVGNNTVKANLNYYVEKVFNLSWSAIRGHGVRNTKKEKDYYDKARFRGYITTALSKSFGASTDKISSEITKAVKQVLAGGNPSLLFDQSLLAQYKKLKASNPGKWATFRTVVKTKLKGKVTMSDIDKAISVSSEANVSDQIEEVVRSFDWVEGTLDKGLYCKTKRPEGYSLIGLDGGVESDLYVKALDLFDGKVINGFEKNVMKYLAAKSRDAITSPFLPAIVEARCHTRKENNKHVLYFNLGADDQGKMTTCVVKEDNLKIVPSSECPVVWSTDKQLMPCTMKDGFDSLDFDANCKKFIPKFIRNLRKFVTAEYAEDLIEVVAWMVTAVVNTGTAPLLEISGASGDGKSTSALFIKELIDPTSSDIKDSPDLHNGIYKKEDLAKVLRSRHVTIFDNLSNLKPYTQDLLCSVATGWKYDLRLMYTQQFLSLNIKKPLILTSLAPVITNQDLRSRSLSIAVSRRSKQKVGDVYALWESVKDETRLGFFLFVTKVLKSVNLMTAMGEDMNDRDMWINAARLALMIQVKYRRGSPAALKRIIQSRKNMRDIQESLTSSTSSQIIAWIYSDTTIFRRDPVIASVTELYQMFKTFTNDHAGETVVIHDLPVEFTLQNLPQTPTGFGVVLSKIRNDIHAATGWDMQSARPGGVRKKMFVKEVVQ